MNKNKTAKVTLSLTDWESLINFVLGDLHNMPNGDETKMQMDRILDDIRLECAKADI